ncbi:3-deoxy-7-phosphoheptulonate synthase [Actinokineospora auranticolor]|uniref:3-deoxy-D-arabinoheptulosonate-7-phosphate synthase n=1 Tax=Actinokineospora auranticolor TaxID=155976 RepID=A0A2S6GD33_9PSEU|nr:3-deoxy-7-phosphoheptulonate synthase [Actinokineospora auranticolor]PPK63139.1 3-deoxy-D-arabinoheptulosonate-7-phosphate synthase [Actinokineospora auranticolor]
MTVVIRLHQHATDQDRAEVVDRVGRTGVLPRIHSTTLVSTSAPVADVSAAVADLTQVAEVDRIGADYPKAAKRSRATGSVVRLGQTVIGGTGFAVIAGPCSVENPTQMTDTARAVRDSGAHALRGGIFKPRTSPYSFQGLGQAGLDLARAAKEETGLPFVTEVVDVRDVELLAESVDMLQIGARNMQNYALLREVGATRVPVLLKRGLAATVDETLLAAEYLLDGGNEQVVLCERGIRTFETSYRFTLDMAAVAVFRERTHLPVIVDPSHAAGERGRVIPLALAAAAGGADGIIVESHCDPAAALCDGKQALPTSDLPELMHRLRFAAAAAGRRLEPLAGNHPTVLVTDPAPTTPTANPTRFRAERAS